MDKVKKYASQTRSSLWVLCVARFGSVLLAARAIGVHPNTLFRAVSGTNVSLATKVKLERTFGDTFEQLVEPMIGDAAEGGSG
jgi:hypothetical protein